MRLSPSSTAPPVSSVSPPAIDVRYACGNEGTEPIAAGSFENVAPLPCTRVAAAPSASLVRATDGYAARLIGASR